MYAQSPYIRLAVLMRHSPRYSGKPGGFRVLAVAARYLPLAGGTEVHTYETARRIAAAGHDVTVLTTNPSGELASEEWSEGVRILRVPAWPAGSDYYFAPQIYRTIREGDWDIVHCQGYHTFVAPLAMLAARRAKVPYLVTFHSGGHSSRLRAALRKPQYTALRPLLARAARLIAVSDFEARFFCKTLRLPSDRFTVIPNGFDLENDSSLPSTGPDDSACPLIVSIGRLERYKGHQRIVEAMPLIARRFPDVRLRVLGSGPYEKTLRKRVESLALGERVEIGGIPPGDRAEMARILAGASLVTLFSEYEAHPISVMEAVAQGCKVLVADTSGLSELTRFPAVRAIPLGSSAEEIARAAIQQLHAPSLASNVELPAWNDTTRQLLDLYGSVIEKRAYAS